jgi:hypothetical protein
MNRVRGLLNHAEGVRGNSWAKMAHGLKNISCSGDALAVGFPVVVLEQVDGGRIAWCSRSSNVGNQFGTVHASDSHPMMRHHVVFACNFRPVHRGSLQKFQTKRKAPKFKNGPRGLSRSNTSRNSHFQTARRHG